MSRKKNNDASRKEQVHLYLTKAEKNAFAALADKRGMSISLIARLSLVNEMNRDPEIANYYAALKKAYEEDGSNNAYGYTSNEYNYDDYDYYQDHYKLDSHGDVYIDDDDDDEYRDDDYEDD